MADILSLRESVLVYLDRSGGLQKLVDDCLPFNGRPNILLGKYETKLANHIWAV